MLDYIATFFGLKQIAPVVCDTPSNPKAKSVTLEIVKPETREIGGKIFKVNEPEGKEDSNWSIPESGELLGRFADLTKYDTDTINLSFSKDYSFKTEKYIVIKTLWAKGEEWTAKKISASLSEQGLKGYSESLVQKYLAGINRAHREMQTENTNQ